MKILRYKEWAKELFDKYPQTNGIIAIAIFHEALKCDIAVTDELQIIGYNDILQSSLLFRALSTIR